MNTSIFAFATDLHDEGLDVVLDNIQHRGGVDGISLAAVYHAARDVFPHNPVRKVRFLDGGVLYFRPDPARWSDVRLPPRVSPLASEFDALAELTAAGARRGLAVHAWTVYLHAERSSADAQFTQRNAFGDPYLTDLCPANPDVRTYVRALSADIARYGVETIIAESLHYHPLEHGYHHERYLLELGPRTRFLLSLCFCGHCLQAARRRGVDADAVLRHARQAVERVFAGGGAEGEDEGFGLEQARELAGGEMAGYLATRADVVASLTAQAAEAAAGTDLVFMDLSGAIKGYDTGTPSGAPAVASSWELGVDPAAVARGCSGLEAMAYAADPERARFDLAAYRARLPDGKTLSAAIRPMPPDCASDGNLRRKLELAQTMGLDRVDLYHYGLAPLTALDRIRSALTPAFAHIPRE